ncbi:amino acid ABC transporter permease [Acetonema longum]|uniref:Amino acid abc transporter membrane protein, paat family n=1 Tax=Acetonema longum DSM 6540 TaxID=1009370 RepID=F7NP32_9FIRM|nr:amino acid ABC transporter permease [Acetonema longum]EGO62155.1 amino acid abc transporter membrane protein, paat family [Acetonema longum DSM 6540]
MHQLEFKVIIEYMPAILDGLAMTVQISALSIICGTVIGVLGALARISGNFAAKAIANAYVEWIRNTPLLIQILFIYFGLGMFFDLSPLVASVAALSIFAGAYITEIIRAGIQSIHKGQREAALSIGMTETQAMLLVVLPQAIRRILPPLAGQFITLIKDSSLVSVIAVTDLTYVAKNIVTTTFRAFEVWLVIAVFYFVLSFILSMAVRKLERRLAKSD